jgi:alkylation response protein AidB-like acyl-CoA dehydrogenase
VATISELAAENYKLKLALERLLPWAGQSPDGPDWATPEAKARNREMCERAIDNAFDCFPEHHGGMLQSALDN